MRVHTHTQINATVIKTLVLEDLLLYTYVYSKQLFEPKNLGKSLKLISSSKIIMDFLNC